MYRWSHYHMILTNMPPYRNTKYRKSPTAISLARQLLHQPFPGSSRCSHTFSAPCSPSKSMAYRWCIWQPPTVAPTIGVAATVGVATAPAVDASSWCHRPSPRHRAASTSLHCLHRSLAAVNHTGRPLPSPTSVFLLL
uniref:Uncharacterized protein n=1 Tax=Oryza sativa subsp. japonica TaxID=39947 RepID=Q6Z287_ORYSJ|nr:hypothetical protein [Oryza sativa Japonica Group]